MQARVQNKVLRYVGTINVSSGTARISLMPVLRDHPLAGRSLSFTHFLFCVLLRTLLLHSRARQLSAMRITWWPSRRHASPHGLWWFRVPEPVLQPLGHAFAVLCARSWGLGVEPYEAEVTAFGMLSDMFRLEQSGSSSRCASQERVLPMHASTVYCTTKRRF